MADMRFTKGKVITVDAEIAWIESLVEDNFVDRMVNIVTERMTPGWQKVHVMTLGTPLVEVRKILKEALAGVNDMIGPEK